MIQQFNVGPAFKHYHCFTLMDAKTMATVISDTVEFLHSYLMQPSIMPEDRIVHGINMLASAINQAPVITTANQLKAIDELSQLFKKW